MGASRPAAGVAPVERARQIKRLLNEHRKLSGGHSPLIAPVINKDTFDAVRPTIDSRDADALVELALDDAADLRSAAVHLLADVDARADERLRHRMSVETDKNRRDRLEDALLDLKVIRAAPPAPASGSSRKQE